MKKVNFLKLAVILFSLFIINITFAGDRMMIIEFFTSSTCAPCASNNPIMTAFINSQDPERLIAIGHHMNWPAPGNDPMYLYNSTDNTARRTYYGINSIPEARYDGIISVLPAYNTSTLQGYYNSRKDILSPVTIILTDSTYATDSVLVRAKVYCETMLTNPSVTVFISMIENHIHYTSPPGTNGEMDFYWVMRKIFPTGNGSIITLYPGQTKVIEQRFKKDPVWQWSEMSPIAYVQDASHEILNAAKKTANFTLLPYPAFKVVTQGQAGSGNFRVRVPNIATGYNSPITFTATVSPANTGITVSFPNGNILSNMNDSLSVLVNSTSAVATGAYKIILQGTNGAGKTHTTTVDYLVGKSYVTIGSAIPGLDFKVNGTTYNSSKTFNWDIGSTQTLQAVTPQTNGSTRYVFTNWSNNGDTNQTQNITVNTNTSLYLTNFKTQFRLLAFADPSGIPVTINGANIYYDSGTTANVSVTPTQVVYNGITYYFNHWFGTGTGSYSGTNTGFQTTVFNPINEVVIFDTIHTGISSIGNVIPTVYKLYQNYPNPFNPVTKIKFDLPKSGITSIKIYDILGKEVNNLYNNNLSAGTYEISFDASSLSSGIYFYKIKTGSYTEIRKMTLLK